MDKVLFLIAAFCLGVMFAALIVEVDCSDGDMKTPWSRWECTFMGGVK